MITMDGCLLSRNFSYPLMSCRGLQYSPPGCMHMGMLPCERLTDLAADAEFGAMLKTAFEGEKAPVTLLNFVSAPEAWQPSEKELNQTGTALLNRALQLVSNAACGQLRSVASCLAAGTSCSCLAVKSPWHGCMLFENHMQRQETMVC